MTELEKIAIVPEEAADLCNVGIQQVYGWIKEDNSFPAMAIGRKTIIPVEGLKKWINDKARMRVGLPSTSVVAQIVERKRRERRG